MTISRLIHSCKSWQNNFKVHKQIKNTKFSKKCMCHLQLICEKEKKIRWSKKKSLSFREKGVLHMYSFKPKMCEIFAQ